MALWELRHRDDYTAFRDALIEGYRQHRERPDEQLRISTCPSRPDVLTSLTSADAKLCAAAAELGMNVANPLESEPAAPPGDETAGDMERFATTIVHRPAAAMTGTSGLFGIPLPRNATPDPDRAGFTLAVDVGTIQDMVELLP